MRCRWFLFALVVVPAGLAESAAQPPVEPKGGKLTTPFTVDATPTPLPALKYQLLPEVRDLLPGSQLPAFYKCFFEQHHFYHDKEQAEKRQRWLAAPLADLAAEKELVGYGRSGLRQADYAARLESVDWQLSNQIRAEGVNLLLPDLQQFRMLASALKARMRGEVARKEYAAARRTAQTMFALARTLSDHPTLIGNLVGQAITTVTVQALEELVQQPGAPNLFWALADLPAPFIDLRKGMQGERVFLGADFDALAKTDPLTDAELKRLTDRIDALSAFDDMGKPARRATWEWYGNRAADAGVVAAARERLAKARYKPADLEKLSPRQLVMMDDYVGYTLGRDEVMKWTNLPYWQIPPGTGARRPTEGLFSAAIPAFFKVRTAQVRTQQRIALLQAVEAVRAHAAENGGNPPAALDAIRLPVPVDPVTGKPFGYEVRGGLAVIRTTPPADLKNDPYFNRVYEITVRKEK